MADYFEEHMKHHKGSGSCGCDRCRCQKPACSHGCCAPMPPFPVPFVVGGRYYKGQLVTYEGNLYLVNVDNPTGVPGVSTDFTLLTATGPQGPQGPEGPEGPQGPAAVQTGELLVNGGFETYTAAIPDGWTTPEATSIAQTTAQGEVYTGTSALRLLNGGGVSQEVEVIPGAYYELSFYSRSIGTSPVLTASVTFSGDTQTETALTILTVNPNTADENLPFAYYRGITAVAPEWANAATVTFTSSPSFLVR